MIAEAKPATTAMMTLDGVEMNFTEGETIYEVAQRADIEVPTLCYDPVSYTHLTLPTPPYV